MTKNSTKKLLFVTGAGASASLTKKDSVISGRFDSGKYQTLPLGNELIQRIVAYKSKSLCWLVSLFCWRLVNDFAENWQTTFFEFVAKVEKFWPENITDFYQPCGSNSEERDKIIENFLKEKCQLFLTKEQSLEAAFFQNSNFLKEELSPKNHKDLSQDALAKILLLTLLERSVWKLEGLVNQDKILTEKFLKNLWNEIKNILANLQELPKYHGAQDLSFMHNTINCVGIYEAKNKAWKKVEKELLSTCGNLKNQNFLSAIEHLKNLFVSASIVEHYQPYSIDYFMMNLHQLAPFEFFDSAKKLSKEEAEKRERQIQKYAKFIIAECLGNSAIFGKTEARITDNYLRRLSWKILENAFFYYRAKESKNAFEKYLKDDVKIITFNYENSLDLIAFESFELETAKHFLKNNVSHVYGYLELKVGLKESGKEISQNRSNWGEDALLKSLFHDDEKIELFSGFFGDGNTYLCKNFFEQIDKSIKWIGEEDDQEKILANRKKYQNQFNEADEIYFLGFGFDNENLYQLGIINKNQQLENSLKLRGKKILISGANPKIVSSVRKIFKATEQIVDATLTTLSKPDLDFEILLSSKFLPEALSQDL